MIHQSVLLHEAIDGLITDKNGIYIDATFGRGGHTQALLEGITHSGKVIALDQDPKAQQAAQEKFKGIKNFNFIKTNFAQIENVCEEFECSGNVSGVLFDLGVSSPQLEDAQRGFSFLKEGPIDMRMDPTTGIPAMEWLAKATAQEISWVLKHYGEERFANRIARSIVQERSLRPLTSTKTLAALVSKHYPRGHHRIHPATRTFQAIRIFINQELEKLEEALKGAHTVLRRGGRLAVISFHSLEDRIAKRFFLNFGRSFIPKDIPVIGEDHSQKFKLITKKALVPSESEMQNNPRARSAKLRIGEKIQ